MLTWPAKRVNTGSNRVVPPCNEPKQDGIHERKDCRGGVEHGEIELLARTAHIVWQRHGPDDPSLHGAVDVFICWVVEVSKRPALRQCG